MTPTLGFDPGFINCSHSRAGKNGSVVLVTVGNTLRGDDGVAQSVCRALPSEVAREICHFDLGTYSNLLSFCLAGHGAAIIVDAMRTGAEPGCYSVVDLSDPDAACRTPAMDSTHGFSVIHELQIAEKTGCLPAKVLLFGIEVANTEWTQSLSVELTRKVPELTDTLVAMIRGLKASGAGHSSTGA